MIDRRSSKVADVREDRLKSLNEIPQSDPQLQQSQSWAHSERHAFRSDILLHMKALYDEQLLDEDNTAPRHLLRVQMGYRWMQAGQNTFDGVRPHKAIFQSSPFCGVSSKGSALRNSQLLTRDDGTPKCLPTTMRRPIE